MLGTDTENRSARFRSFTRSVPLASKRSKEFVRLAAGETVPVTDRHRVVAEIMAQSGVRCYRMWLDLAWLGRDRQGSAGGPRRSRRSRTTGRFRSERARKPTFGSPDGAILERAASSEGNQTLVRPTLTPDSTRQNHCVEVRAGRTKGGKQAKRSIRVFPSST
jgi:antitoxin (DNA-binding transcriptional repressor) of toxin-antitoxin stability system